MLEAVYRKLNVVKDDTIDMDELDKYFKKDLTEKPWYQIYVGAAKHCKPLIAKIGNELQSKTPFTKDQCDFSFAYFAICTDIVAFSVSAFI